MPYHGSQKGKSYLKVGKINRATSLWQQSSLPACLPIDLFVCVSQKPDSTWMYRYSKAAGSRRSSSTGSLGKKSSGRGISFHDSVSAALPESRSRGGRKRDSESVGWGGRSVLRAPRAELGAISYSVFCLVDSNYPWGKWWGAESFFALLTQSD